MCSLTSYVATGYLHGLDIIGETSLLVTNKSQNFHWAGYGMKLHVPESSLPAGVEECRIDIKAALTGQFGFPERTVLVSAMYHIHSKVQFSKPLTLEIQHCAKTPDLDAKLEFVVAKHTQELPYSFSALPSGVFTPYSSYGSIHLSGFSLFGIILKWLSSLLPQAGPTLKSYCAHVYYTKANKANAWLVHFSVTLNLEVCIKVSITQLGACIM